MMTKNLITNFERHSKNFDTMVADALLITVLLSVPATLTFISVHFYYVLGLNKTEEEIHVRALCND